MAGSKERLARGNIRSAEEETTANALNEAIDKEALRDRAMQTAIGRKELQGVYEAKVLNQPAPTAASTKAPPATTATPATTTKTFGTSTDIPESVLRPADAEGRSILKEQYNKVMAANDAESARLAKEGEKADTINSILDGGTDALKAATERLQAKYQTAASPTASEKSGLEGTLSSIAESRAAIDAARRDIYKTRSDNNLPVSEAPVTVGGFGVRTEGYGRKVAAPTAAASATDEGDFKSKFTPEERAQARTDAAAALASAKSAAEKPKEKKPDELLTTSDPEYWTRKKERRAADMEMFNRDIRPTLEAAKNSASGLLKRASAALVGGENPLTPEQIKEREAKNRARK